MFITSKKKIFYRLGTSIALLGILFVGLKLWKYHGQLTITLTIQLAVILTGLILIYGIVSILAAYSWRQVCQHLGILLTKRWSVWAYGTSQLAKYLPGNLFQFASRQAIGTAFHLPGWLLVKSYFWELIIISTTGALFSVLIVPIFFPFISQIIAILLFSMITCFYISIVYRVWSIYLASAIGLYLIFLMAVSLIFVTVLLSTAIHKNLLISHIPIIGGAYIVAWLIGLVTPGAPAGIGVREVMLYTLLHTFIHQSDLLTAIVLSRIITISGDICFYLLAVMFFKDNTALSIPHSHPSTKKLF